MTTPDINELTREFRKQLLALDEQLAQQLMREHRARAASIQPQMQALFDLMRRTGAIDDGARWIRDQLDARALIASAEQHMTEFAAYAAGEIERRRQELIAAAAEHSEQLTYASIVGNAQVVPATAAAIREAFTAIPVDAVTSTVGALQPTSPLRELFDEMGPRTSTKLSESLITGITNGEGAEEIARRLRDDLDGNASRALTIARTETHRSYRNAHLDRWRANPRVYAGWSWHASLDSATCPACVAMHGSVHSLDEDFGAHPNCRCRPLPITRPLSDLLGRDDEETLQLEANIANARAQNTPTGPQFFDRLSASDQDGILGKRKARAYRSGDIRLEDAIKLDRDTKWGVTRTTGSLEHALKQNATRKGRATPQYRLDATLRGEVLPLPRNRANAWGSQIEAAQWNRLHRELAPYGVVPSRHLVDNIVKHPSRAWVLERMPEIGAALRRAARVTGDRTITRRPIVNHDTGKRTELRIVLDANGLEVISVFPSR